MSNIPDNIKKMWEAAAYGSKKESNPYTPPLAGRGRQVPMDGPKPGKKPIGNILKGPAPHISKHDEKTS